jgi:2-oxoacid:acceptor oxidoreductase delta subunit (pyruvate/2-ketoisovalerate family)
MGTDVKKLIVAIPTHLAIPVGGVIDSCEVDGEQPQLPTGGWRLLRSVIDQEKCTKCLTCWLGCPEPCIHLTEDRGVYIDLKYCKGCGICADVCPVKCISRVPESDFKGDVEYMEIPF